MTPILIDTNAYTAFKQGLPDVVDVIQRAPQLFISSVVNSVNCLPDSPLDHARRRTAAISSSFLHRHELLLRWSTSERLYIMLPSTRVYARRAARYQQTICGSQRQRFSMAAHSSVSMVIFSQLTV